MRENVDAILDNRTQAIVDYINSLGDNNYTKDNVKVSEYMDYGFETPEGEFLCVTNKEADKLVIEDIKNLMDDCGLEAFSKSAQEYIINHFAESEMADEWMKQSQTSYYNDIECESASKEGFTDRCQEELFEFCCEHHHRNGADEDSLKYWNDFTNEMEEFRELDYEDTVDLLIEKIKDCGNVRYEENGDSIKFVEDGINFTTLLPWLNNPFRDEALIDKMEADYFEEVYGAVQTEIKETQEWFDSYDDKKDDYIEDAVKDYCKQWTDSIEWIRSNFGDEELTRLVKEGHITFDYKEIAEYVTREDGRGNSLARYDGEENFIETDEQDFYIYKTDNTIYERDDLDNIDDELEMSE